MFKVPEQFRYRGLTSHENNGAFTFMFQGYQVQCIASDGLDWEHVSVTIDRKRCPGWDVMCHVKDLFWSEDDTVVQFHPKKPEYVDNHPYCLHIWRKIGSEFELPESIMVGFA